MIPKQYRIHVLLMLTVLVIIVYPMLTQIPDEGKEKLATAAATKFFDLVDSEQYAESWQTSADLLKEKVSKEDWVKKFTDARFLTGPVVSREKDNATYSPTAKDSPDGEYIVLNYDTKYARQGEVTETVTVMLDKDGRWRVAGYFIQ